MARLITAFALCAATVAAQNIVIGEDELVSFMQRAVANERQKWAHDELVKSQRAKEAPEPLACGSELLEALRENEALKTQLATKDAELQRQIDQIKDGLLTMDITASTMELQRQIDQLKDGLSQDDTATTSTTKAVVPRRVEDTTASAQIDDASLWMQKASAKLVMGPEADVQLFRSAASELTTNSDFVAKNIVTEGNVDGVDVSNLKAAHDVLDDLAVKATTQEIKIGGSKDKMYPVWFNFPISAPSTDGGVGRMSVFRDFAWNGGESERPFDKSRVHQAGLLMVIEGLGYPWGGNANILDVVKYEHTYTGTVSHVQFRMHADFEAIEGTDADITYTGYRDRKSNPSKSGFYLRGGGVTYRISNNWGATVQYQDGSDPAAKSTLREYTEGNIRWFVTPLDWADHVAPKARFKQLDETAVKKTGDQALGGSLTAANLITDGVVRLGSGTANNCGAGDAGSLRFEPEMKIVEVCAGDGTWTPISMGIPRSCAEILAHRKLRDPSAQMPSGQYTIVIRGAPLRVFCDMETDGGGWTLFEYNTGDGTDVPCGGTGDINPGSTSLLKPDAAADDSEAKLSDETIKALWLSGSRETLWRKVDAGQSGLGNSGGTYVKLRFTKKFVDVWKSFYHIQTRENDPNKPLGLWQQFYRYSDSTWYWINGHYNNFHFTNYNDWAVAKYSSISVPNDYSAIGNQAKSQNDNSVYWATRSNCKHDNAAWQFKMYAR